MFPVYNGFPNTVKGFDRTLRRRGLVRL
jgi:hypothetical protein